MLVLPDSQGMIVNKFHPTVLRSAHIIDHIVVAAVKQDVAAAALSAADATSSP
jgi:hypothetical protein